MTEKSKTITALIISIAGVLIVTVAVVLITPNYFHLKNAPEQIEQVEVVGKRIEEDGGDSYNLYCITFKFFDGPEKEFSADRTYYNAIYIGDTGRLTYKERESGGGRFEKFEKDPDCGGGIIEPHRREDMIEMVMIYVTSASFLCVLLLALFYLVRDRGFTSRPEQTAQVKVIGKRLAVFAFEFPDGSVKEVHSPHIIMQINDAGSLTYKERENIEKHIKREKSYWRGRQFVRFEKDNL